MPLRLCQRASLQKHLLRIGDKMSLARNTFTQFFFTMFSRLLGYARDRAISNMLGAGFVGDAFATAQMFPNLFRRILAEGAFSQAFVPVFARTTKDKGKEEALKMASETFSVLLFFTIIIVIIAQICMPWIMLVIHSGYKDDKIAFNLAILLTQLTMPYLIGMALSSLFSGVLNTFEKFALSSFVPSLQNICILALIFWTHDAEKAAVLGAIGITISGVLQAAFLYYGCHKLGFSLKLGVPKLTPNVKTILALMGPAVISGSATQINVFISQALASFETGAKSWLYAADRLFQLPLGLIGVAIGVALLPRLSKAVADTSGTRDDHKAISEGFVLSMALTLPAAVALLVIPYFLMYGFWLGGKFGVTDVQNTAYALTQYAWGVPAFVLIRIFAPPFFAHQDTKSPMNYAIAGVIANIIIGAGLFLIFHNINKTGYIGLAIGTSIAAWINALLLGYNLLKRDWWRIEKSSISRMIKIIISSIIMGIYLYFAGQNQVLILSWFEFMPFGGKELAILIVSLLGFAIYGLAAIFTKALTMQDIRAVIKK